MKYAAIMEIRRAFETGVFWMSDRAGRQMLGFILVLLGIVFLLPGLNLPFIGWHNIWPLFIIVGGLTFLVGWALTPDHEPGLAFVGIGALLIGAFLALFAWEILSWSEMAVWWPAFPFIGGLAFMVLWAAGRGRDPGILIPACGGILTGAVAFVFTKGIARPELIVKWWPVVLIALGVAILFGRSFGEKK